MENRKTSRRETDSGCGCKCPDDCPAHSGVVADIQNISQVTNKFIEDIKNNHLPHIYDALEAQKTWLIGVLVSIIFLLAGVITSIFVNLK